MSEDEITTKILRIAREPLTESAVAHLFALTRKLIEKISEVDRAKYALLKFYCDWTVHSEIDRSAAGAEVLKRVHDVIYDHIQKGDDTTLLADLGSALSVGRVRMQLNQLLDLHRIQNIYEPNPEVFGKNTWQELIPLWGEIVSRIPLKINPRHKYLARFLNAIQGKPLKGTAVVQELEIIKVSREAFPMSRIAFPFILCFMITLTDTTHIVAPIVLES